METKMECRELPEMPRIWLDFLSDGGGAVAQLDSPALSAHAGRLIGRKRQDLSRLIVSGPQWCSDRTYENVRRIQKSDSVAVVATVDASVLGGTASQILKCLTAIKAVEELAKRSIPAVPVCWVQSVPAVNADLFVTMPDAEGKLHRLFLKEFPGGIPDLVSGVEEFGSGAFDPEIIQMLGAAYSQDVTLSAASARIFSNLMKEWGLVALDARTSELESIAEEAGFVAEFPRENYPSVLLQSSVLPVLANVVGPYDCRSFAAALPCFEGLNFPPPMAWPESSATIVDSRSRKTLEKYGLKFRDLFAGEINIMNGIKSGLPDPKKLDELRSEAGLVMAEIADMVPGGSKFLKAKATCENKITYQIDRMRAKLDAAKSGKLQAASRQVNRACSLLAPERRIQERELAGIYLLLRYSRSVLDRLHEELDATALKHQLIEMD